MLKTWVHTMLASNSKRNFITGRKLDRVPKRPPWSCEEQEFTDLCSRCGDCIQACPKNIILKSDGGFPEVNFSTQGCDFCELCVDSCTSGALNRQQTPTFRFSAIINDQCFSMRGIVCRSCGEICESRAITFKAIVGGRTTVALSADSCTGCGECIPICPADSISMKPIQ